MSKLKERVFIPLYRGKEDALETLWSRATHVTTNMGGQFNR